MMWKVKYILTLLLVVLFTVVFAGDRLFFGRIINTAGVGLPMGVIESKDHHHRFYANNEGVFSFTSNPDSIGIFTFSAQGYVSRDFVAEDLVDDSVIVELTKRQNMLAGASVSAKGRKEYISTSGVSGGLHSTSCYLNVHDEIAIYLPADKARNGMLKEIGAYITKEGQPNTDFIMHVYARDSATGAPGDELTDSVLVMHGRRGNQWVTADLSAKYIQVHGGVYVSVEWSIDNRDAFHPWNIPQGNSNYYAGDDIYRNVFNGQALGMAWQNEEPKVYRRYASNLYKHKDEDKWFLTPPATGGHKARGWITPMIYYTYSYTDR